MSELEPRVAVIESRVDSLDGEMQNTRTRLHLLETDRAVLQLMVAQVSEIRADVKALLSSRSGDDAVMKWKWRAAGLIVALLGVIAGLVFSH